MKRSTINLPGLVYNPLKPVKYPTRPYHHIHEPQGPLYELPDLLYKPLGPVYELKRLLHKLLRPLFEPPGQLYEHPRLVLLELVFENPGLLYKIHQEQSKSHQSQSASRVYE